MKLRDKAEKLESFFAAPLDFLACRKTNTAPKTTPNIDVRHIEQEGISLEELDKLNVPVYKYHTQITLHGIWPDTLGRCLGYKYLMKNQNNSIGIRYGAIDGTKKKLLRQYSRFSKFGSYYNSTENGFLLRCGKHKLLAIKAYKHIEKNLSGLFIGSVNIFYDAYFTASYYIDVGVAAIPEKNFAAFAEKILKVSQSKYEKHILKQEAERAESDRQAEERRKVEVLEAEAARKEATEKIIAYGLKPFKPNGKDFRGIKPVAASNYNVDIHGFEHRPAYKLIEVKRKAFGPCFRARDFATLEDALKYQFDWSQKARRLEKPIELLYA